MDAGNPDIVQFYDNVLASRISRKFIRVKDGLAIQPADIGPTPERDACNNKALSQGIGPDGQAGASFLASMFQDSPKIEQIRGRYE